MNYQTFLTDAMEWMFSDLTRSIWIMGGIAVIGAALGVKHSLNYCKGRYNGRIL